MKEPTTEAHTVGLFDKGADCMSAHDLRPGACVSRFVIINQLGQGGMGVVYKAYDPDLDRRIAIKLLTVQPSAGELVSEPRDRLVREAQALAKLNHPNVVAVHDVGPYGTGVYIAMEFIEGKTLRQWVNEDKPSREELLQVYIAAGRGLQAAHAQGIIHRDFKPDNVMLDENGRVRILDFGLAKAAPDQADAKPHEDQGNFEPHAEVSLLATPLTKTAQYLGTALYMAPEQIFGVNVTERSDQFSFCVALFEALYGARPFQGKSLGELYRSINRKEIIIPKQATVPKWIERILQCGLSKNPADRYPSMAALLDELGHDPERQRLAEQKERRRRLRLVTLVFLLIALPIGIWHGLRYRTVQLCQDAKAELRGVWDRTNQTAIHKAFLDTQKSFAAQTWKRVKGIFDNYLTDWKQMRSDVCQARWLHATQSEELFDLRMGCLRKRLREFKALLQVFTNADSQVVQKATQASSSMTIIATCADEQTLRASYPPPTSPDLKAKVASVYEKLAQVEALSSTGRVRAGLELAQKLVTEAEMLVYRPLQAEALYWLGYLLEKNGKYQEAEKALYRSANAAGESGDSLLVGKALSFLVPVIGYAQGRHAEGLSIGRAAEVILVLAKSDEMLRSRLFNNLGGVLWAKGSYDEALAHFRKSLALRQHKLGPDHPNVAQSLNAIGLVLSSQGRYQEALVHLARALRIREKALGSQHPKVAYQLHNTGMVLLRQGQYDKAQTQLEKALVIWKKALGPDHPNVAGTLNELGHVLSKKGEYKQALAYQFQSLAIREKALGPDHPLLAWPLSAIGNIYLEQGKPQKALDPLRRSRSICASKTCNPEPDSRGLFALAQALVKTAGDTRQAIEMAKKAQRICSKTPKNFIQELQTIDIWLKNQHTK